MACAVSSGPGYALASPGSGRRGASPQRLQAAAIAPPVVARLPIASLGAAMGRPAAGTSNSNLPHYPHPNPNPNPHSRSSPPWIPTKGPTRGRPLSAQPPARFLGPGRPGRKCEACGVHCSGKHCSAKAKPSVPQVRRWCGDDAAVAAGRRGNFSQGSSASGFEDDDITLVHIGPASVSGIASVLRPSLQDVYLPASEPCEPYMAAACLTPLSREWQPEAESHRNLMPPLLPPSLTCFAEVGGAGICELLAATGESARRVLPEPFERAQSSFSWQPTRPAPRDGEENHQEDDDYAEEEDEDESETGRRTGTGRSPSALGALHPAGSRSSPSGSVVSGSPRSPWESSPIPHVSSPH
mmetsp:Transcript_446/g.1033  ORF Transcript_446/g.1033 Transcript_446/m.1033 type:complete len:355 (+) Transcript_446:81-1145(+)